MAAVGTPLVRDPKLDPRFVCYKLEIRGSKIHRYGVYALENIPANRKVIEYTGERCNRREAKKRGEGEYTYLFAVDNYWTLDGAVGGSGAEIINHSCEPNLVTRVMKGHILYVSLRPIKRGEELTVDYNLDKDTGSNKCGVWDEVLPGDAAKAEVAVYSTIRRISREPVIHRSV